MSTSKIIPFICIVTLFIQCKEQNPSHLLSTPTNWKTETLEFPFEFAPDLKYTGISDIRFAPGWKDAQSMEYFSYTFLWALNENPKLSAKKLETEMASYFFGLMDMVSPDKLDKQKTNAFFEKVDEHTYIGKVLTHDAFITKKNIKLNLIVTHSYCPTIKKHYIKFNVSPQHINHKIWSTLEHITPITPCK
ncbi:hypothetical protein HN014_17100 [Aquimarina sp. TRL1]|uniref:hypothetical protein n=1 Tax=Aquimarina sp. (strain TRL1) TaxID=2736252 RepID=UPI00158B23EF|nr:hypothetical protein [Aquimarina sp. TRL1]QKX06557.1 hypothetical protein HN014_17100 [Aquimarina sp. TRL1]